MDYTQILLRPVISEKANVLKDEAGQVVFQVHPAAGKVEIQHAVEKAFGVKVLAVNVVRRRPLTRHRQGRAVGRVPGYKKAYVTLAPGDKIDFFEGV